MRALVWYGKEDIRCETVPDPNTEQPSDAIVKVTSAICGSNLYFTTAKLSKKSKVPLPPPKDYSHRSGLARCA